jgi:membrane fusion protein, multidrug efflux system
MNAFPRFLLPFLLLPGLLALGACREEKKEPPALPVKVVKYTVVGDMASGQARRISGVVETDDKTEIAFQIGGRVETVNVTMGDHVKEGQVLATLEKKDYELAYKAAESRVASSNALLSEKSEILKRQRALFKKGHVAQAAVDTANSQYEAARSNYQVTLAERDVARLDYDRTVLYAPYDGQISERLVEPFMEVNPTQTLFRIQRPTALTVRALVPETIIRQIAIGENVEVTFPTLTGATVKGTITEIGALAQQGNAFPVKVLLRKTAQYDIRVGMTAQVFFMVENYKATDKVAYLIPISALDLRGQEDLDNKTAAEKTGRHGRVFVIDPATMTLRPREVAIGNIKDNKIEVIGGLEAGEKIVTAGVPFLEPGQKVGLWEPVVQPSEGAAR